MEQFGPKKRWNFFKTSDEKIERDSSAPAEARAGHGSSSSSPPVDLETCLDLFTEEETLDEMNAWYCSNCKELKSARKQMDIWKIPDVCIVHLKRFSSYGGMFQQKNNQKVNYPLEIDLKKWVLSEADSNEDCKYELFGVVQHLGGIGGGHYVATVKSQCDEKWYLMNDASTKEVKQKDAVSESAYLLFYSRISKNEEN